MSEPTKPTCPNPNCGSDDIQSFAEHIGRVYAWCSRCGTTLGEGPAIKPTRPMQPDASAGQPTRRVRTSDAANDIGNAFAYWEGTLNVYAGNNPKQVAFNERGQADFESAQNRVTTWLTQVEAEQRQLRAAMLACQAMAAVADYGDMDAVHAARKLALDAIAEAHAEGQSPINKGTTTDE